MRLWSIHPKYLDSKGLVALWREALLAQNVLLGKTKGYKNHPQLIRFKSQNDSVLSIGKYLNAVYKEAKSRNYNFNKSKIITDTSTVDKISVTSGQLTYEFNHLKKKLEVRDVNKLDQILQIDTIETHPLFIKIDGKIESWEVRT